jgi:HK97 family phage portal protein
MLTGNAYWFLAGDARGRPAPDLAAAPDRVAVVPDEQAHVRGYVYTLDGREIPLEAVEVIHFRRWHPRSDYYGLSALHAAQIAVQSDVAMARWNRDTFSADRAVPAGIVNLTEFVSDSDFERIKREWRDSYGGPERRTAFLRGGAVQWQSIGLSQQDVDFLAGRRFNREEIFQVFGLPLGMLSENATEANARIAERVFVERTLWPKLVRLAGKLTAELLPFWGSDLLAAFDDIRPQDVAQRLAEVRTAYPVLSINELRARYYDLPPVAWGEAPVSGSGARAADGPQPSPWPTTKPDPASSRSRPR